MKIGIPIFFVLVVTLLVIAIKYKGFWKDRGLMKTTDGKHPLHWLPSTLPIPLLFHPSLPQTYVEEIRRAIRELHSITGNQIFDLGTYVDPNLINFAKLPRDHIAIELGLSDSNGSTSLTWDERTGVLLTGLIKLPPSRYSVIGKVVKHELVGHGLGFDHDEVRSSIMHPQLQSRPQYFTAEDVKLRKRYYSGNGSTNEG
jgi:hypothetical protein